jgi:hypothetical protein
MGKTYETLEGPLLSFINSQQLFFVATAPLGVSGHLNLSPKGLDSFRVLGPRRVAYLDQVGSGAETIAHLRENGRIIMMLCAFEGPPNIVRLHGRGTVIEPQDDTWATLRPLFPAGQPGRAIIQIDVDRISDSCGFGVPEYAFTEHRSHLTDWVDHKGTDGIRNYQRQNNCTSLDGLPALRWVANRPDTK